MMTATFSPDWALPTAGALRISSRPRQKRTAMTDSLTDIFIGILHRIGGLAPEVNAVGVGGKVVLPVLLERHLAVMLAEEIQEPLVIAGFHVEESCHDLVVATGFFQTASHDFAHVAPRNLALHVQRVDGRPEGLTLIEHPLVQVVRNRAPPLALWPERNRILDADFHGEMIELDRRA